MLRLLLADDHPLFRMGLRYALTALDFSVVAEAANGAEALERCRDLKPDALLLDVKMPVMDGLAACKLLHQEFPFMPILLLTTFSEPALIATARDAGAMGFVSKETDPNLLASILRRACTDPNHRFFPDVDLPDLSPRELEVLRYVAMGLSNKEIARKINLSPETVKDYVLSVFRKLEVDDRVTAATRAKSLGLT